MEILDDDSVNSIKDLIICNYLMQHNMFSNLMLNEDLYNSQKEKLFQEAKHYFDKKYNVEFVPRNYDEVKNIYDLLRFMDRNISVGYIDKRGQVHYDTYKNIHTQYKLARIYEIIDKKVGTCAEQAKLIKFFLDSRNIENKVFYCSSYNGTLNKDENYENIMCQHLLVFAKYKEKWNYIEQAYSTHQGIFQFNNLTDALTEGAKEFFFWDNFELYEINDIKDGLSFVEMYDYFSSCKPIEWSGNNVKDFRVNYKEANNLYSTELCSKK